MTARESFERALRGMLEFACCDPEDDELAPVLAAADTYRAEGLRALADALDADAHALDTLGGDAPWAAMLGGIKVKDAKGGAGLLRRAAALARERAGSTP